MMFTYDELSSKVGPTLRKRSIVESDSAGQHSGSYAMSSRAKYHNVSRRSSFDQYVLPVMSYGSDTWLTTMGLIRSLTDTQRAMERATLEVSLRYRIRNEEEIRTDDRWGR